MENRKGKQDQSLELSLEDLEIVAGGLVRPMAASDNPFEDIPRVPNQDIPDDWRPTA